MTLSPARPDVLALLYDQQRNFNTQIGLNHESLSKLYRKLAKIERVLAAEQDQQMKRSCRKKWKWSQMLTKKSIAALQDRQETLYQHLDQCVSLLGSYREQTLVSSHAPWMHLPPSPYMLTPSTPFPFSPWAVNFSLASPSEDSETTFWDLSRLREPSPFSSMADSGYCEPRSAAAENGQPSFNELDQIFSLGMLSPSELDARTLHVPLAVTSDFQATTEEDGLPEPRFASPSTKPGAQTHRRCVSAEVAQLINGGLDVPSSSKRGTSVGPTGSSHGQ